MSQTDALGPFSPILPVPVGEAKAEDRRDPRRNDYVIGCPPSTHPTTPDPWWWTNPPARDVFRDALIDLLNFHNVDAAANTPDYVLADFLMASLDAWDQTTARRDVWRS